MVSNSPLSSHRVRTVPPSGVEAGVRRHRAIHSSPSGWRIISATSGKVGEPLSARLEYGAVWGIGAQRHWVWPSLAGV